MGTIFRLTLRKWERTSPSNGTQPLVLPAFLSLPAARLADSGLSHPGLRLSASESQEAEPRVRASTV